MIAAVAVMAAAQGAACAVAEHQAWQAPYDVAPPDTVRWIFYTSGTTANPKGVLHTDRSVAACAHRMNLRFDAVPADRNALVFPVTHIGGIAFLAVIPALNGGSWLSALVAGAVLGLVAYGTYDLTNLSTVRDWSVAVTVTDLAWGTVLTATAATAGDLVTQMSGTWH